MIKFCNACGSPTEERIPAGDNRPRAVCSSCGTIQYRNPKIVVGCVPVFEDRILLCRRAIEPRHGLWTLPAGFMENGESAEEGAAREAFEEANATVEIGDLYTVYSLPHVSQIYMMYLSRLVSPEVSAGIESLEVRLATADEIPWDHLAFTMVRRTLRHFLEDRAAGAYRFRSGVIRPPER